MRRWNVFLHETNTEDVIYFKSKFKTHSSFLTNSSKTLSYAMSTTMVTLVSSDTMVILHFDSSLLLSSIHHLSLYTPNI